MARYKITNVELSQKLRVNVNTVSILKNADKLPAIGSDRICQIAEALSELSGEEILPLELLEYQRDKKITPVC